MRVGPSPPTGRAAGGAGSAPGRGGRRAEPSRCRTSRGGAASGPRRRGRRTAPPHPPAPPAPEPPTRGGTRAPGAERAASGAASARSPARTEPGGAAALGPGQRDRAASCARRPEAVTQPRAARCGARQRGSGRLARRGASTGRGGGRARRRVRSRRRWRGRRGAGSPPDRPDPTRGPATAAVGAAAVKRGRGRPGGAPNRRPGWPGAVTPAAPGGPHRRPRLGAGLARKQPLRIGVRGTRGVGGSRACGAWAVGEGAPGGEGRPRPFCPGPSHFRLLSRLLESRAPPGAAPGRGQRGRHWSAPGAPAPLPPALRGARAEADALPG